jgi:hypothetical protein
MTLPAISTTRIADLIPNVTLLLQNRSDIGSYNPGFFIQRAVQELTLEYPFEELRTTGPQVPLVVNQYSYPVSYFTNPGDDYTTPYAVNIFVDYPQNTVAFPLHYETPAGMRPMTFIPGAFPARWSRFGPNIWLGPQPQYPYVVFVDYQIRHPFDANLEETIVRMPAEWLEVVEYSAAYRMAAGPLRWMDMATYCKQMLYGDPKNPQQPGLIAALVTQPQLDQKIHSRRINVRTGRGN